MRLNFTDHYMNDYITEFKKDLNKIINDLIEKNIINDFNFNKLSIDYSSKSKQGDISTNLFLILLKQNLKKNYDLIICSRQTGGSYDLNFSGGFASAVRASGVILLVSLFDTLFKTNFTDILNGFRGVRKKSFLKLKTKENGFAIEIDILIQAVIKKQRIKEIPSRENVRKYGESKLPTIKGLYFIYFIIKQYLFYKLKID